MMKYFYLILLLLVSCKSTDTSKVLDVNINIPWPDKFEDAKYDIWSEYLYFTFVKIRSGQHDKLGGNNNEFVTAVNFVVTHPQGVTYKKKLGKTGDISIPYRSLPKKITEKDFTSSLEANSRDLASGLSMKSGYKDLNDVVVRQMDVVEGRQWYNSGSLKSIGDANVGKYYEVILYEQDGVVKKEIGCRWVPWDAVKNDSFVVVGDRINKEERTESSTAWVSISNRPVNSRYAVVSNADEFLKKSEVKSFPCMNSERVFWD